MRKLLLLLVLTLSISTAFAGSVIYTDYNAWLAATPPEPATMVLLGAGLLGIGLLKRSRA